MCGCFHTSFMTRLMCGCKCHKRAADPRLGLGPRPVTKSDIEDAVQKAEESLRKLEARLAAPPSLRDQFAMAALTGLLASNSDVWPSADARFSGIARMSYRLADSMLKAREVKP